MGAPAACSGGTENMRTRLRSPTTQFFWTSHTQVPMEADASAASSRSWASAAEVSGLAETAGSDEVIPGGYFACGGRTPSIPASGGAGGPHVVADDPRHVRELDRFRQVAIEARLLRIS